MKVQLGIDLGTSNIVVAYREGEHAVAHQWSPRYGDKALLPASVQIHDDQVLIGLETIAAWERGDPYTYRRFKMSIGSESDAKPSAEELMTILVQTMRQRLIEQSTQNATGFSAVDSAVITVPHGWNPTQRRLTVDAVQRAGITVSQVVSEPIAAAAYYAGTRSLKERQVVLVCDMGGGTFDITLTEISPEKQLQLIARGTETNHYAGTYADALIAARFINPKKDPITIADEIVQPEKYRAYAQLLSSIERARRRLNDDALLALSKGESPDADSGQFIKPIPTDGRREVLTYEEMEGAIRPVIEQARQLIRSLLARLPQYQVQGVVLAGGMGRMLALQRGIAAELGINIEELRELGQNADSAIACGAVLINHGYVQVEEIVPQSVGIIAIDNKHTRQLRNRILIPRGTAIPDSYRESEKFETNRESSDHLTLLLGIGESEDPNQCKQIEVRIKPKRLIPAGTPYRFGVRIDENLIPQITVLEGPAREIVPIKNIQWQ